VTDGSQIAAWQLFQPPGTEHDFSGTSHHTTSPHHSVSSGVKSHQEQYFVAEHKCRKYKMPKSQMME
jgi:hypothetical protein